MTNINNLLILFFILILLGFLNKRFEEKRSRENSSENYKAIQTYLLDDANVLGKSKKPILWIHIPYEYNSRNWVNFGSRNTYDLNQPYLYLTIKSILSKCDKSFKICIVDDTSFKKLIPNWDINMSIISSPVLNNIRTYGMMRLLYLYGGLICPMSFLCMKNLHDLYTTGTHHHKMFLCELVNRNITSTLMDFYPSITFCGAPPKCEMVNKLCNYIQTIISTDTTSETKFLGQFDRWCMSHISKNRINLIDGIYIGTKDINSKQIILDDLLSSEYLKLYNNTYGILIPSTELLERINYEWFIQMSPIQVLKSNTIIGNYLLLSIDEKEKSNIFNETIDTSNWIKFWKTPHIL